MKSFSLLVSILIAILWSLHYFKSNNKVFHNELIESSEARLLNLKQLTFSGENAEAYFSKDEKYLIFQSHEGDSLCDQIYIMNIKTGAVEMVSTGEGVTTCSYFLYPECKKAVYASTHLANKECPPKPDYSKGYVWKLYPGYDIFLKDLDDKSIIRLTDSPGYDAEATVAFDGSKIVYTSMISGDLEIWTMGPKGENKTQLTNELGYDGGAFFNSDASKIVWRVYHPKSETEVDQYKTLLEENSIRPMALQIWTMDADGSNKQQITNNGAANFGPYFFPGGNRIIFSSNLHDVKGRNFDLYSVNIDGSNLERITFFDGFDGFPMFSPNGKHLVFASNRNQKNKGDTNLFLAEWNYQ